MFGGQQKTDVDKINEIRGPEPRPLCGLKMRPHCGPELPPLLFLQYGGLSTAHHIQTALRSCFGTVFLHLGTVFGTVLGPLLAPFWGPFWGRVLGKLFGHFCVLEINQASEANRHKMCVLSLSQMVPAMNTCGYAMHGNGRPAAASPARPTALISPLVVWSRDR